MIYMAIPKFNLQKKKKNKNTEISTAISILNYA